MTFCDFWGITGLRISKNRDQSRDIPKHIGMWNKKKLFEVHVSEGEIHLCLILGESLHVDVDKAKQWLGSVHPCDLRSRWEKSPKLAEPERTGKDVTNWPRELAAIRVIIANSASLQYGHSYSSFPKSVLIHTVKAKIDFKLQYLNCAFFRPEESLPPSRQCECSSQMHLCPLQ